MPPPARPGNPADTHPADAPAASPPSRQATPPEASSDNGSGQGQGHSHSAFPGGNGNGSGSAADISSYVEIRIPGRSRLSPELSEAHARRRPDLTRNIDEARCGQMVPSPLRRDLVIQKQRFRGEDYYVIKDPLSLSYYRLEPEETFLILLVDGERDIHEIGAHFHDRYPNSELTHREIAFFLNQMANLGLLNLNAHRFAEFRKHQERSKPRHHPLFYWALLTGRLIFLKLPLVDPSPWLGKLTDKLSFLWSRWFVGACLFFLLWTAGLLFVERGTFAEASISFFSPQNIPLLWLSIIFIKTLHEFGHATTCRHYGGEVHEMGVALICFTPCGYVNASDAWMMRERRHKIYVTLAGIFTEFCIAAVAAHVWLFIADGLARNLAFNIMIAASVNTLFFNMNPLMRFDGYYVISDLLEAPNLRSKAIAYCSSALQRLFLGLRNHAQEQVLEEERDRKVFIFYAIASYLYMIFLIYSLSLIFARVLAPYGLVRLGLAIGVFVQVSFITLPLVKIFTDAFSGSRRGHVEQIENPALRLAKSLGVVVLCIGVIALWPARHEIDRQGVIIYDNAVQAASQTGGEVAQVHVETGQRVRAGDLLATLSNSTAETGLQLAAMELQLARLRLSQLQDNPSWESERRLAEAETALRYALERHAQARAEAEALLVRAPRDGCVLTPGLAALVGRYMQPGETLMRVGDEHSLRLLAPLREDEMNLVDGQSRIRGRWLSNGRRFEAPARVLPRQAREMESWMDGLLTVYGGAIPPDAFAEKSRAGLTPTGPGSFHRTRADTVAGQLYLVEAPVPAPAGAGVMTLPEGMRAQVTVVGKETTVGVKWVRAVIGAFASRARFLEYR